MTRYEQAIARARAILSAAMGALDSGVCATDQAHDEINNSETPANVMGGRMALEAVSAAVYLNGDGAVAYAHYDTVPSNGWGSQRSFPPSEGALLFSTSAASELRDLIEVAQDNGAGPELLSVLYRAGMAAVAIAEAGKALRDKLDSEGGVDEQRKCVSEAFPGAIITPEVAE